jgi:hypothetical protein
MRKANSGILYAMVRNITQAEKLDKKKNIYFKNAPYSHVSMEQW